MEAVATNVYRTPLSLAQDILLIRRGLGDLSDDDRASERQILFWIAGVVSQKYQQEVQAARGIISLVERRLWHPLCIQLDEKPHVKGPHMPLPQLYATACLPTGLLSSADNLLLTDVFYGDYQLAQKPLATIRQGPSAYSRFGKASYGWASAGPTLYCSLPFDWDNDRSITALGVELPSEERIVDHPEEEITWLPEWTPLLRAEALKILGITEQGAPDAINNGADKQSDKR